MDLIDHFYYFEPTGVSSNQTKDDGRNCLCQSVDFLSSEWRVRQLDFLGHLSDIRRDVNGIILLLRDSQMVEKP